MGSAMRCSSATVYDKHPPFLQVFDKFQADGGVTEQPRGAQGITAHKHRLPASIHTIEARGYETEGDMV